MCVKSSPACHYLQIRFHQRGCWPAPSLMQTSFTLPSNWALGTTTIGWRKTGIKPESFSALCRAAGKLPVMKKIKHHNNYRCTYEQSPERGPTHMQMHICSHAYRTYIYAFMHACVHTQTPTVHSHGFCVHTDTEHVTLDNPVGFTALCRTQERNATYQHMALYKHILAFCWSFILKMSLKVSTLVST